MSAKSSAQVEKMPVAEGLRKPFRKTLLLWYGTNKRSLPWRETKNPYRVWLSEIMLQQTRVDQATSFYLKFCRKFPTVKSLAQAQEDEVLKAWQGLGYYSRARNLHHTAKTISDELKGKFPASFNNLLKLKGVGNYTAAAIASICFDEPVAVVDGNVERVIARIFGVTEPADSTTGRKKIQAIADELLDKNNPGDFNQAMMEMGAIQCTPKNPDCDVCVFEKACFARQKNFVHSLPVKSKRTLVKDVWMYYFVFRFEERIYLRKRDAQGIWKNMHDFPSEEYKKKQPEKAVLKSFFSKHNALPECVIKTPGNEIVHVLSHRKIHAQFYEIELSRKWTSRPVDILEVKIENLEKLAVPRLIENFLHNKKLL